MDQTTCMRALLEALEARNYHFITPTPATHRRVIARPDKREARTLADVFGWSLPFSPQLIDADVMNVLTQGRLVEPEDGGLLRATVRASRLRGTLYLHSAYPTVQEDAVFFGPDSYRFASLLAAEVPRLALPEAAVVVDVGTGAGVGAILTKQLCPAARVIGTDVNSKALRFAAVNADVAGLGIETISSDTRRPIGFPIDLAIANPPYIIDGKSRAYRDGGGLHGAEVAIDMVRDMLAQLAPSGAIILYTGSAIVNGHDRLRSELEKLAAEFRRSLRYSMLDPDVFGEELAREEYNDVDRIELVAAVFTPT